LEQQVTTAVVAASAAVLGAGIALAGALTAHRIKAEFRPKPVQEESEPEPLQSQPETITAQEKSEPEPLQSPPENIAAQEESGEAAKISLDDKATILLCDGNRHLEAMEYQKAIECYWEAEAQYRQTPAKHQGSLAAIYNNLAVAHSEQGEYDRALELYRRAYRAFVARLGPEDPQVKLCRANAANIYEAARRKEPFARWLQG